MNVDAQLVTVSARVLNSPDVKYDKNKIANTRFGSWNMASVQFSACPPLSNWTYLNIVERGRSGPCSDEGAVRRMVSEFTAGLRAVGISATDCIPGMRITVDPAAPDVQVEEAIRKFKTSAATPPRIILVILPQISTAIYRAVKYSCDVQYGLLNVCVVAYKFARANSQYHANVALKFNLKLGGRNQTLQKDKLGIIAEGKTMVVGMDVTHPAPGSSANAPSVASIVASVDPWLAQWPADLRIQKGRQEKVNDLADLMASRLNLWRAKQGKLPENILIYRDGVSEGQYQMVVKEELPELRRACDKLYPGDWLKRSLPRITVVVVGKRHHAAFYPTRKEDADRSSNAPNGTVVDRGVTEARGWDFFLQAHAALQGTARSAHYYVVHDEIFRKGRVTPPFQNAADVLENLTHNLCYLFGRATKAVSLCPPAYYADLACDRSRCYIGGLIDASPMGSQAGSVSGKSTEAATVRIHPDVKDTMFYI
jgi:eukaryotic translation initiation factor 2C